MKRSIGLHATVQTLALASSLYPGVVQAGESSVLRDPTFESLANTTITTVARKSQPYLTTAAATNVITREDIASTGIDSVPDALRLAPGLHVAQINAYSWAITARGFNSIFSDKLVALIDNRSVYTPLWSGVYWEQHAWLGDEIDRIEVVRGPGGSKWGTNAVNGAVNIFTRSAEETQGFAASGGIGTEARAFGSMRYGGALGESGWVRMFGGYQDHDASALTNGVDADDAWDMARVGVRYDGRFEDAELMLQGGVFNGDFRQHTPIPTEAPPFQTLLLAPGKSNGGHVHGSWTQHTSRFGTITTQAYFDRSSRDLLSSAETRETIDVEAQQQVSIGARQELTWGLGYRNSQDNIEGNFVIALDPPERTLHLWSAFVEDEIVDEARGLALTIGAKFEYNDFTDWEVQPSARIAWTPAGEQTVWAALSRAVRRPNRVNEDLISTVAVTPPGALRPGSPPTLVQNIGSPDLESETMTAFELGWRAVRESHSLDIAAFYNDYNSLITFGNRTLDATTPETLRLVSMPENAAHGHSYGIEISGKWLPTDKWLVQADYTWLRLNLAPQENRAVERLEGSSPEHTLTLRASLSVRDVWRIDAALRYVDRLPALDVPDYVGADLSIAREVTDAIDVALMGRNLWSPSHIEFISASVPEATEVERSAIFKISWRTE